jgi:hypothetical protein
MFELIPTQGRIALMHRKLIPIADWLRLYSGFFGFVIAVLAMAGTWYQGVIAREHNELSVRPSIRFGHYFEGAGKRNGVYIENFGLGTARITQLSVRINSGTFNLLKTGGARDALRSMGADLYCFLDINPEVGTMLRAGATEPLLAGSMSPLCHLQIARVLAKQPLELHVSYLSPYDKVIEERPQTILIDKGAFDERVPGILNQK